MWRIGLNRGSDLAGRGAEAKLYVSALFCAPGELRYMLFPPDSLPETSAQQELPRLGRYELVRRISGGGLVDTYVGAVATKRGTRHAVMIKQLKPRLAQDRSVVDAFLAEARVALSLSHPNIVRGCELVETEGQRFLVLEFLRGRDLRCVLKQAALMGLIVPMSHAIAIVRQAAAGLHYAHRLVDAHEHSLHLVHGELAPRSVFVCDDGVVKLLDFAANRANKGRVLEDGETASVDRYRCPEQRRGQRPDVRSDVYGLGILLYELTTGARLPGSVSESEPQTLPRPSSILSDYPERLEGIVMKALASEPGDRFRSVAAMEHVLARFADRHVAPCTRLDLAQLLTRLFALMEPRRRKRAQATVLPSGALSLVREGGGWISS